MGFFLKKVLGAALMPLPSLLLVGVVGWLLWIRGRRRAGPALVGAALLGLLALSTSPAADALLGRVETPAPPFPGDSVDFVVVLGHGHVSTEAYPVSARLTSTALHRLAEGVAIATAQPWSRLVLSGFGGADPVPNAYVYRDMALLLGFPGERIVTEPRPRDTAEEAEFLAPLLAGRPFALVTSASHMERALRLFRARGLAPVPAPTGHLATPPLAYGVLALAPDEANLFRSRTAWYEALGRIWSRLTGKDRPPGA